MDRPRVKRGMNTTLFVNPAAGDEAHSEEALTRLMTGAGLAVRPFASAGAPLQHGLRRDADLVVVAGGDGTVGKVVTQLDGSGACIAVLPLGTANNLGRALETWDTPEDFAAGWREARRRSLDIAYAEGPWGRRRFVEAAGFGAFARAVERADEKGLKGVEAGRAAFRAILARTQPVRVKVTVDGTAHETETLFLEVMNIPLFGPNLALAPDALPGDGALDVVVLPPERRDAMMAWLGHPEAGPPPTEVWRGTRVALSWPGGPVRLDDQCMPQDGPGEINLGIEADGLRVVVPPRPARKGEALA